jgi:hypothetical protein
MYFRVVLKPINYTTIDQTKAPFLRKGAFLNKMSLFSKHNQLVADKIPNQ